VPGEVVGSGEEDLRCRSLLTVCQRRLGLSEAEDTRLEKYSFDNHASTPPHSFFYRSGALPAAQPAASKH